MKTNIKICFIFFLFTASCFQTEGVSQNSEYLPTNVKFKTSDQNLQAVYDSAESKARWNINHFRNYEVIERISPVIFSH